MKLILAPSAQTDTSIAVVWDKPEDADNIEEYVLYLNGREAARVKERIIPLKTLRRIRSTPSVLAR